jgi:hypothetical protein
MCQLVMYECKFVLMAESIGPAINGTFYSNA